MSRADVVLERIYRMFAALGKKHSGPRKSVASGPSLPKAESDNAASALLQYSSYE